MLSLRIVAGGAVFLLVSGAAVGRAAAQDATDMPGRPLQLLRIVEEPEHPAAHSKIHRSEHRSELHRDRDRDRDRAEIHRSEIHHSTAALHRSLVARSRRHLAVAKAKLERSERAAENAAAATLRPETSDTAAPVNVAAADPAAQPLPSPSEPVMGRLVVGDQPVAVASQSDVNELDLAANANTTANGSANAPQKSASAENTKPDDAAPTDTAAPMSATVVAALSDSVAKSDSIKAAFPSPAATASLKAAPAPHTHADKATVGSPGWIAQVMAAAAGAVAAGSLAWFLIGSAPLRTNE
jgi:hypothetical protein